MGDKSCYYSTSYRYQTHVIVADFHVNNIDIPRGWSINFVNLPGNFGSLTYSATEQESKTFLSRFVIAKLVKYVDVLAIKTHFKPKNFHV
jgi:hypothetical protein